VIYETSSLAIGVFAVIVGITLGLSFYLGSRAKSSQGFFAAGGGIHWFVNGVAFAGDYLSAASFLGICGMIAFYGYDGFLYSIGYLAGWVVALFVIAEPMKRLGKYTLADALDSRFQSRGIKLAVAISTLAVSIFYLIPQMVGAGVLITPLFNFPHYVGVILVGAVVTIIVVTAGMVSTTYVQFIKGSLLVVFSAVLTVMILYRGLSENSKWEKPAHVRTWDMSSSVSIAGLDIDEQRRVARNRLYEQFAPERESDYTLVPPTGDWSSDENKSFIRLQDRESGLISTWYELPPLEGQTELLLVSAQTVAKLPDGRKSVNGLPQGRNEGETDLWPVGRVYDLPGDAKKTGPLGPLAFLRTIQQSEIVTWGKQTIKDDDGTVTDVYYPKITSGRDLMRPGNHPAFQGIRSPKLADKLNFLSLMLALFCGTASLPHILIRYYTVKDQTAARKSTIVGIGSIGFFYVLTLFIGLGAMTSGALDVTNNNMAAPLLAKSFNEWLFAIISAIAFTTVLGTVSGLIIASSGAVVHDLLASFFKLEMHDHGKVRIAKIVSAVVGVIAIVLGIVFEKMNVTYLVGWAFSVAASANLPSLVMLLFWKRTTKQGITAAVTVGMVSSLAWILLSADTFKDVYGYTAEAAAQASLVPFSQPGIVTIPLGFVVLIVVSLLTPSGVAKQGVAE
jgi:cation/acetate symporter